MIGLFCLLFVNVLSDGNRLVGYEPKKRGWQGTPEEVAAARKSFEAMREKGNYTTYDFNPRVTQGMYSRGYGKVRLSVITRDSRVPNLEGMDWDYSSQFVYMWTDNYLHTKIVDAPPGKTTDFKIDGETVSVRMPEPGKATRGYLFADPCFQYSYSYCRYADDHYVFNRHTEMINYLSSNDQLDWWMIGGDNFYDNTDYWSVKYFGALNTDAKATLNGMVLGNHDYWHDGNPGAGKSSDQLGIGMTQYYAQDVLAGFLSSDGSPYDFSQSPWNRYRDSPPPFAAENSIFWYKIGNMGILGYSGAYYWETYEGYVDQACQQFSNDEDIKFLVVVGHWDNNDNAFGEQWNMDTPTFLESMKKMGSCEPFKYTMKYVDGHDHSNRVYSTGFKIGANGFVGTGQVGALYLKTDDEGRFWAYYIEFQSFDGNYYDHTFSCIQSKGIDSCLNEPGVYLWYDSGPPMDPSCYEMLDHQCTYKGDTVSCGDRINWLIQSEGMDWVDAYNQVNSECGSTCSCKMGPTKSPTTGPPTIKPVYGPCDEMLTRSACDQDGCHSCGDRIEWLEKYEHMSEAQAYAEVAEEFPGICQCDDPPKFKIFTKEFLNAMQKAKQA